MATSAPHTVLYSASGAATLNVKMSHASAYNTGSGFVAGLPSCVATVSAGTVTPTTNSPIFCYGFKRAIITPLGTATNATAPTFAIYAIHANNNSGGTVTQSGITMLETVAYAGAFATAYGSIPDQNGTPVAVNVHAATATVVTTGMAIGVFDTMVACTSGTAGSTNTPGTIYISNLAGATHLCICFTSTIVTGAASIGYTVTLTD